MRENQVTHFAQILVLIANSTMGDISHDFPELPRYKACYVTAVTSCDVIKGHQNVFFANNYGYKRDAPTRMVSLCSAYQDASNDLHSEF